MPDAFKQCTALLTGGLQPVCRRLGGGVLWAFPGLLMAEPIEILYEKVDGDSFSSGWGGGLALMVIVLLAGALFWLYRRNRLHQLQFRDQLEQAQSRLREAQLIARIGSWSRDFESGETFWSDEACKLLGLTGREREYKHYERLIHPDDLERVTEVIAAAYHQGGAYQCDHRVICPGNVEKYIRLAGQVYMGDDNAPVRETGTVQDITGQRLAETIVQRSEQRLRAILDATPFPILILEKADFYPVLYANRSTYSLFGLDSGLPPDDIRLQHFWLEGTEFSAVADSILTEGPVRHRECLLRDVEGRNFWCELTGDAMDFSGVDALFVCLADITERRQIQADLERMATTDFLTGALNRRSFLEAMQRELRRSIRYHHLFTVLMLDIDYFKKVNDNYGHAFGDEVIRRFSDITRSCLREEDLFGRLGGEEFAVVLVASEEDGGYLVAERIRKRWQEEAFEFQGARCNFTVSIGVAPLQSDLESVEEVLDRADKGLYSAKRAGRNCVIVYSGDHPPDNRQPRPA